MEFVYELARILVHYIKNIYYKDPVVINESFAKIDKPTILVSNHPNTLLDAVIAAATVSKQVNFLANYGLFKSKFGNAFFSLFYCIPIQRKEDMAGKPTNNKESIARSHSFLAEGGTLYVAAEGGSIHSLGIRPLKTGAARIGLNTENENDWKADVQILPLGLNYDESDKFRSNLVIQLGKPFLLREWRSQFFENNRAAVRDVTKHLTEQMQSILLHGEDHIIEILKKIRKIKKAAQPTDPKREYLRTRSILHLLKKMDGNELATLSNRIDSFESSCQSSKYQISHVAQAWYDKDHPVRLLSLFGSSPITIFGVVTNVLPYVICHFFEKRFNTYFVYRATFRVVAAMLFIPLMYLFWMWLISSWTSNVILTLGSLLLYRRAGVFAWDRIQDWKRYFKSKAILKQNSTLCLECDQLLSYLTDRGL